MRFITGILILIGLLVLSISCGGALIKSTGDFSTFFIKTGPDPLSEWEFLDADLISTQSGNLIELSAVGHYNVFMRPEDETLHLPLFKIPKRKDTRNWIHLYKTKGIAKKSFDSQYRLTRSLEFLGTLMGGEEVALINVLHDEHGRKIVQFALPLSEHPKDPWEPYNPNRSWRNRIQSAKVRGWDLVPAYGVPYHIDDDFDLFEIFERMKPHNDSSTVIISKELRTYDVPLSWAVVSIPAFGLETSYPGRGGKISFHFEDIFPDSIHNLEQGKHNPLKANIRATYVIRSESRYLEEVLYLPINDSKTSDSSDKTKTTNF